MSLSKNLKEKKIRLSNNLQKKETEFILFAYLIHGISTFLGYLMPKPSFSKVSK